MKLCLTWETEFGDVIDRQVVRDPLVARVVEEIVERSEGGFLKYQKSLEEQDFHAEPVEWLQEMKQELMDGVLYCEKAIKEFAKNG